MEKGRWVRDLDTCKAADSWLWAAMALQCLFATGLHGRVSGLGQLSSLDPQSRRCKQALCTNTLPAWEGCSTAHSAPSVEQGQARESGLTDTG